jgi:GntR family transcriptional regulator, transcriptional repressor for pyruvate dehydrogenase complex
MEQPPQLDLRPVQKRRAYEEVVDRIRGEILAGRLRVGDRLPGERQLSEMLGVSRASVREAMRVLESLSIIRARTGTGPESGSVVVAEVGSALSDALVMHTALDTLSLDEVVDVRGMLESYAVRLAAKRATPDQLDELRAIVEGMRQEGLEPQRFLELDTAFHLTIAAVSGNRLAAHLMRSIRDVLQVTMDRMFVDVPGWETVRREVAAEHGEILDAVSRGDAEQAAELLEAHIHRSFDRIRAAEGAS